MTSNMYPNPLWVWSREGLGWQTHCWAVRCRGPNSTTHRWRKVSTWQPQWNTHKGIFVVVVVVKYWYDGCGVVHPVLFYPLILRLGCWVWVLAVRSLAAVGSPQPIAQGISHLFLCITKLTAFTFPTSYESDLDSSFTGNGKYCWFICIVGTWHDGCSQRY